MIIKLVTAFMQVKGCEINQGDCAGRAPLVRAVNNEHIGVAKLLLGSRDLDLNRPEKGDNTPLLWGAHNRHEEVVTLV